MEKKYIECEALLKTSPFTKYGGDTSQYTEGYLDCAEQAREAIRNALTADVEEVRHGKWIPYEQPLGVGYSIPNYKPTHYCSHCKGLGWEFYTSCPHCSARMDGKGDNK